MNFCENQQQQRECGTNREWETQAQSLSFIYTYPHYTIVPSKQDLGCLGLSVEAYTVGKTQLLRSHCPKVCREDSHLIVSCLSLDPLSLEVTVGQKRCLQYSGLGGLFCCDRLGTVQNLVLSCTKPVASAPRTTGICKYQSQVCKVKGHNLLLMRRGAVGMLVQHTGVC